MLIYTNPVTKTTSEAEYLKNLKTYNFIFRNHSQLADTISLETCNCQTTLQKGETYNAVNNRPISHLY